MLQALAARATHFTGADLTALVREAGLAALMVSGLAMSQCPEFGLSCAIQNNLS